jgi:hypothetical protein
MVVGMRRAENGLAVRRAIGVFLLSAALLSSAGFSGQSLEARQESEGQVAAPAGIAELVRPRDLSDEALEEIDADFAAKAGPLLAVVFDSAQTTEAITTAANELLQLSSALDGGTETKASLKRRIGRRVALVKAARTASDLEAPAAAPAEVAANVAASARRVESSLKNVRNGSLWSGYLHLPELTRGDAALPVLKQVRANLTPTDSMSEAQKEFIARPELLELASVIDGALSVAGYEGDATAAAGEQKRLVMSLATSLLDWEQTQTGSQADTARAAWRVLRGRFPAAAEALRPVLNQHYLNHNLHFTVSENLLSRLVADYRTETGCIADCIMGAWVTGSQNTSVDVRADVRPSTSTARFDLRVTGNTRSNTMAQKDPATVWTSGNHYFWISKSVAFDGRRINSTPASFSVDTNSWTTGLATKYDGIPIIRGIVRRIASKKVAESKPQSEAITASRMQQEALPRFEQESEKQFSESNAMLSRTLDSLTRRGVAPDSVSARSSETQIAFSARTIGLSGVGGSLQPPAILTARGASVQLHESGLNNAIDALGFQGRAIPEKDIAKELEVALSELFQRDIKLSDGKPEAPPAGEEPEPPTEFVFSSADPIRIRFSGGQIIMILQAGIRQEGREEIPEQIITIPISMTLENGKVVLDPGTIAVASKVAEDRGKQLGRAAQIRRILKRRIIRRELSPTIDLQAAGDKTLPLTVTGIELIDGWLNARFE